MATRTFGGWGGRPKGEPAKVCRNQRFRHLQIVNYRVFLPIF